MHESTERLTPEEEAALRALHQRHRRRRRGVAVLMMVPLLRSPLEGTGDDAPRSWTPKEIP
jgi:hypothetical protein